MRRIVLLCAVLLIPAAARADQLGGLVVIILGGPLLLGLIVSAGVILTARMRKGLGRVGGSVAVVLTAPQIALAIFTLHEVTGSESELLQPIALAAGFVALG